MPTAPHRLASFAAALLIGADAPAWGGSDAPPIPGPSAQSRFAQAPAFRKTLLIVGQERVALSAYAQAYGQPAGLMLYTDLLGQGGLTGSTGTPGGCGDAGAQNLPEFIGGATPAWPRAVLQIGLALTGGQLEKAADGSADEAIQRLSKTLRETGHPILLRIGYEAEGPWNAYPPATYVQAYRRIAAGLRAAEGGAANVSLVWHLSAGAGALPAYSEALISPWYPGDDVVDWIGISWFGEGSQTAAAANSAQARETVAAFARAHGKPLMIGESAPRDFAPGSRNDPNQPRNPKSWDNWYGQVLRWIAANDVRVWSLINQDWRAYPMFAGGCGNGGDIWGDSRLQQRGSTVDRRWRAALRSGAEGVSLLSDRRELWRDIDFAPTPGRH